MKNKGAAYLVVLSMILMLMVLSASVLTISTGHFGTSYRQIRNARAYYAGEAALVHALTKCRLGAAGGYDLGSVAFPYEDPSPPTISDPNYELNTVITILLPGTNYAYGPGVRFTCPAGAPSDYCVFAYIDY